MTMGPLLAPVSLDRPPKGTKSDADLHFSLPVRHGLALPMDCSIGKARQFSPSGLWGRSAQKTPGQGSTVTAHTVDNQQSLLARF
jgi:hypothetical protein